jgi:hypothetical protein
MINNIIRAYSANLLTQTEAKSYVQRTIEAQIAEIEASAEESSARATEIIDRLDCCECDCGLGYEDPEVPAPISARAEEDAKKEELSKEIAKLIKFFEL